MDKRSIEIEAAERELRDYSLRIDGVKFYIHRLNKEIFELTMYEKQLLSNLDILKTTHLTIMASEYKITKDSLTKIANRLVFLRVDVKNHEKVLQKAEELFSKSREKLAYLIRNRHGKVIYGKFGKNGQK